PFVARAAQSGAPYDRESAIGTWLALADSLFSRGVRHGDIAFARARVLACDPSREDEAASGFRELLGSAAHDRGRVAQAFDAFLARAQGPSRDGDRRFLLGWKAERAPDAERVGALLSWASAERF